MNEGHGSDEFTVGDDGREFDPREAATLLERTKSRAQRQFDIRPPLLTMFAAVVMLVAYGAVWVSVRGQHPYKGPTGTALAVLYSTLAVWVLALIIVMGRAVAGVGGRSARQRRIEGFAFGAVWISVYVFQGALYHAGASNAIAYGVYAAAAPWIIVGSAAAAYQAARGKWPELGMLVAAVALALAATFTGPAGVWAVLGLGGFILLLARAAGQLWLRRRG